MNNLMKKTSYILALVLGAAAIATAQDPTLNDSSFNQSSRGYVGTGERVLIGGIIVSNQARVVIRVLGPSIAHALSGNSALMNPELFFYDETGKLIASQKSYLENNSQQLAAIQQQNLTPGSPAEPAIIVQLTKGRYTVVARGENQTRGIALIEIYLVH